MLQPVIVYWEWQRASLGPTSTSAQLCCMFPGVEDDIIGISSANVRGKTVSADCFCWGFSCLNHPLQASYLSMAYQHHSPWHISITAHGISASLSMAYQRQCPWHISITLHGISASLSMVYQHHSPWHISITVHGISASAYHLWQHSP